MRYKDIETYLQDVLGLAPIIKPWPGGATLPYFLQDAFKFASIELLGAVYVLMIEPDQADGASKIRKHMDTLLASTGATGIYVAAVMSSYERKRMIEQRAPFIVPGNQLYLPDLGIDLREYFRQRREASDKGLSPATQALLISALLRPWKTEVRPAELSEQLGYTAMTVSRAVQELVQAELASTVYVGRERWLHFDDDARTVWHKASSRLRNPVKKIIWAFPDPVVQAQARLAGESALAKQSLLAETAYPVYAISTEQWKLAQQRGMRALPAPEPGACQWQVWRYRPDLVADHPAVDQFSLVLSLRHETDERVQQALNEFEAHWPW